MTQHSDPPPTHGTPTAGLPRRTFLRTAGAFAAGGALAAGVPATAQARASRSAAAEPPLKERAAARGLLYSATSNLPQFRDDAAFIQALNTEAAGTTAGGNFLMKRTRGGAPDYPFVWDVSDEFAALADQRGLTMLNMGHLVWHASTPDGWADTLNGSNARGKMLEHVSTVAGRYAGRVHSWNVVNEVVYPPSGRADGLRDSPFLEHIGPRFIDDAFVAAREADPDALLVINDYNLELATPDAAAKREALLNLLRGLVARQVPVDVLGLQAHLPARDFVNSPPEQATQYRDFLNAVEDLGLKIMVTELDAWNNGVNDDDLIAQTFTEYLDLVLQNKAVITVQTWGLSDKYNWQGRFLPLDVNMQRKKAWTAIAEAFDRAPAR